LATYLVAYDDSESAQKALRRTIDLVTPRDLIVIVWVVPDKGGFGGFGVEESESQVARLEKLNAAAAMVRRDSRQAVALLLPGNVADQIVATADKLDANLIILGHKGVSKIGAFALGSVAERVAEMSHRKVLIVK
jgi:nucleotide-binding universal stress UspA family protein